MSLAPLHSADYKLIPKDGLTLSSDGTCVHSHASPYEHKVCKCMKKDITGCSCKRHFSDTDAHWGWDSDEEVFYFGHTLYMLCSHNTETGVDLPLHIRFLDARRHDSISAIISLREFKTINPDIPVKDICLDSAHNNYTILPVSICNSSAFDFLLQASSHAKPLRGIKPMFRGLMHFGHYVILQDFAA